MKRTIKRKRCEFCNVKLNPPQHKDTICFKCNADLQRYTDEKEKRESEHTHKRKCRSCGVGLDISRWWYCTTCKPVYTNIDFDEDFIYCTPVENFQ